MADLTKLQTALEKRVAWHKCSCPEPCDDYNVFPGGCAARYAADYASLLATLKALAAKEVER